MGYTLDKFLILRVWGHVVEAAPNQPNTSIIPIKYQTRYQHVALGLVFPRQGQYHWDPTPKPLVSRLSKTESQLYGHCFAEKEQQKQFKQQEQERQLGLLNQILKQENQR